MNINLILKGLGAFVFLILLQVLLLNNIQISKLNLSPYLYVLFILILPFETPKWLLLVLSFLMGLIIDIFTNSPGSHASAAVVMAFARPTVLQALAPREGFETVTRPTAYYHGLAWFSKYATLLILLHHFMFHMVEQFTFSGFFVTLLKIVVNTVITAIFVILSQYFIFRK
jgi:rod shape-determining protein MreD